MSSPIYRIVRAELRKAGPNGLCTSALLARVLDLHDGPLVKPGHLRAVLWALRSEGVVEHVGTSRTFRGLPERVRMAKRRPKPMPTNREAIENFEKRSQRCNATGLELRVLQHLSTHGPDTAVGVAAALGSAGSGTVKGILRRSALDWQTLRRSQLPGAGKTYLYSLTRAGEAIVSAFAQPMAV